MTDTKKLEEKIALSGKKKNYLAEKVGLTANGLRNCISNKADFKARHIQILCEELNIDDLQEREAIFFAKSGA